MQQDPARSFLMKLISVPVASVAVAVAVAAEVKRRQRAKSSDARNRPAMLGELAKGAEATVTGW